MHSCASLGSSSCWPRSRNTSDDMSPSGSNLALLLKEYEHTSMECRGSSVAWSQLLKLARGEPQRTNCSITPEGPPHR